MYNSTNTKNGQHNKEQLSNGQLNKWPWKSGNDLVKEFVTFNKPNCIPRRAPYTVSNKNIAVFERACSVSENRESHLGKKARLQAEMQQDSNPRPLGLKSTALTT